MKCVFVCYWRAQTKKGTILWEIPQREPFNLLFFAVGVARTCSFYLTINVRRAETRPRKVVDLLGRYI